MLKPITAKDFAYFLNNNKELKSVDVILVDLLGITRGKRVFKNEFDTLVKKGIRAPVSIYVYDSPGVVPENLPFANKDGDPDFPVFGDGSSLYMQSWLNRHNAQVFGWIETTPGSVCFADTRNVLDTAVQKFMDKGIKLTVGIEIEFALVSYDRDKKEVVFPHDSNNNAMFGTHRCNGMEDLYACEEFFEELTLACEEADIQIESLLKEAGTAQFEVAFKYSSDLMRMCDQLVIFKTIVKHIARKFNWCGCFMAKPFMDLPGSGMHFHVGMFDENDNNLIAGDYINKNDVHISELGYHAIGGLMDTMTETVGIFAPNANSFHRIKGRIFSPFNRAWGANNRTVAVRIPNSPQQSTRIEHRLAGSDANPYLSLAIILESMLHGMTDEIKPNDPVSRNTPEDKTGGILPTYWPIAIQEMAKSNFLRETLGEQLFDTYLKNRESECSRFYDNVAQQEYEWYLQNV